MKKELEVEAVQTKEKTKGEGDSQGNKYVGLFCLLHHLNNVYG